MEAQLAKISVEYAIRGATDYLRLNGIEVSDAQRLLDLIRAQVKADIDEALNEAKDAIECNMTQVAECTFRAAMVQAGIMAAKNYEEDMRCPT